MGADPELPTIAWAADTAGAGCVVVVVGGSCVVQHFCLPRLRRLLLRRRFRQRFFKHFFFLQPLFLLFFRFFVCNILYVVPSLWLDIRFRIRFERNRTQRVWCDSIEFASGYRLTNAFSCLSVRFWPTINMFNLKINIEIFIAQKTHLI